MPFILLSGQQLAELRQLMLSAYSSRFGVEQLLSDRLNTNLNHIADTGNLNEDVFKLVTRANSEGWIADLIREFKLDRQGRPDLQRTLRQFSPQFEHDVASEPPQAKNLESVLSLVNPMLDARMWARQLLALEEQVCRIEIDGKLNGTGFLLEPRTVMTCHHVVEPIVNETRTNRLASRKVVFRFDYQLAPNGATTPGVTCELASKDWLIDYQPRSPMDEKPEPRSQVPNRKQLDYALLRLAKTPRGKARKGLVPNETPLRLDDPLFIIGHPAEGVGAQRLSLDTRAIVAVDGIGTRVRYRTNTLSGSSGSPCFTADLQLVAMHQGTDPAEPPKYNVGIPFAALLPAIRERVPADPQAKQARKRKSP